jgi:hypothetical protein
MDTPYMKRKSKLSCNLDSEESTLSIPNTYGTQILFVQRDLGYLGTGSNDVLRMT